MNPFEHDSRVLKEGSSLVNNGYDVVLVCCANNRMPTYEVTKGIQVHRIIYGFSSNHGVQPEQPFQNKYLKTLRILLKIPRYIIILIKIIFKFNDIKLIHCHDIHTLPLGCLLKFLSLGSKKIIYDAHEYETEVGCSVVGMVKRLYEIIERFCIQFPDKFITVSPGISREYERKYGIEEIYVILNCPVYRKIQCQGGEGLLRRKLGIPKGKIIFLYQGMLSAHRGLEELLETFQKLSCIDRVLVFMGQGPLQQVIMDASARCSNIFFHDIVPLDALLSYTESADVGLFYYKNLALNFQYCLPNKLFEYTMAGLPVVVSDLQEVGNIVRCRKIGIVSPQDNLGKFRQDIEQISLAKIKELKENVRIFAKKFCWEEQEKVLLEVYRSLQ